MPDRSLPDVPRLRLLNEVARHGSLAGAAKAVGITSSAVSQQISILERETGTSLLDRGPRGVTLTGAGEVLVERAKSVLQLLEETRTTMDQLRGDLAGRVRVGAISSAASSIVLPAAARLRDSLPEIGLTVTALEPHASLEQVIDGAIDLAVIDLYDHVPIPFPDYLAVTEILTESLVMVAPKGHEFSRRPKLSDFRESTWVMPPSAAACGQAVRYACRADGFEPNIGWETDDLLLLVEAVSAGQGVSLLPRRAVADHVAPVDICELAGAPLRRRILTVARASTENRPIVRAVLDELQRLPQE